MNSSNEDALSNTSALSTPVCTAVVQNGVTEFIPFCHEELKPKLDQEFDTLQEAENFYSKYASNCGFTSRLGTTTKRRGNPEIFTLRRVLCNRAGFKEENKNNKTSRVRMITRLGCNAMVQFKRKPTGTYVINNFYEGHNHVLASPESMLFLKENRKMTSVQKHFVVKIARLKVGGVRAFRGWKELSGGYNNVGATEVDFKNFVRDIKDYIGDFDGQMFIENFIRKKETCSSFYFDFQVDENNRLCRVFWADTISRKNYGLFGDMTSADATYRTNKYCMVFVPFTGVDHNKRCITFGAGLLAQEDVESYKWLFNAFLDAMNNCQPKVLITDQDPAVKLAIEEVFPDTIHRLCMWHIMKKLREKVDSHLWQNEDFKKRINCCVWNNLLDPVEFEVTWLNIMIDFGLVQNQWFTDLYNIREKWIPAYFKDVFLGGIMRVTSMSESENSFFDRFVTAHVTLVEFWMCFESAMDAQRYKQSKLNTDNKHSDHPLKTPLVLEKHGSEIFTHIIFIEFQKEIVAASYDCGMDDLQKFEDTEVYIIHDLKCETKTYQVAYTITTHDVTCTCCLFERMGILCRHALWVLKTKKVQRIPDAYIVNRWTKDAMKKPIFDKDGKLLGLCESSYEKKKLTEELWEEVYSCVNVAEENDEDLLKLIEKLREVRLDMSTNRKTYRQTRDKQKEIEKFIGFSVPEQITIQAPKKLKTKGSGKRMESGLLKALEKQSKKARICSSCCKKGHNSRTCTSDKTGSVPGKMSMTTTNGTKKRFCKSCGKKGHNSRTCKQTGSQSSDSESSDTESSDAESSDTQSG